MKRTASIPCHGSHVSLILTKFLKLQTGTFFGNEKINRPGMNLKRLKFDVTVAKKIALEASYNFMLTRMLHIFLHFFL